MFNAKGKMAKDFYVMRLLMLSAKSEAIDVYAQTIECKHVRTALGYLEIGDPKIRAFIYSLFDYNKDVVYGFPGPYCTSREALLEAEQFKMLSFSQEVKEKLSILEDQLPKNFDIKFIDCEGYVFKPYDQ